MSSEVRSFTDLVLEKGFDVQEALEYGKKKLAGQTLHKDAYLAKFLADKKVEFFLDSQNSVVEKKPSEGYELTNILDMVVDGKYNAHLTVITKLGAFPKIVCGDGFKKFHSMEEGSTFCEKCKSEVEPIEIIISKYLASDSTSTIPIVLAAWLHKTEDLSGKMVSCNGQKQKNGSFNVSKIIKIVSLEEGFDEAIPKTKTSSEEVKPKSKEKETADKRLVFFVEKMNKKNDKPIDIKLVKAFFDAVITKDFKNANFDEEWNKALESGNIVVDETTHTAEWREE